MTLLDEAIRFAVQAHSGQPRKGTNMPYILHPLEAAAIVATMTDDLEIIAAAVLHDLVCIVEMIPSPNGADLAAVSPQVERESPCIRHLGDHVRGRD